MVGTVLMKLRINHRFMGILFIFGAVWIGGEMGWAQKQAAHINTSTWAGKFPVMVIGHRGFSGVAPENTVSAFRKAIEAGCDMVELDVHLSRDGKVVVIHDETLERTTNGKGKIADFTLKELENLDAGAWFGSQFAGEKMPSLREVLDLAKGKILVNIEIKDGYLGSYTLIDLTDRTLQDVKRAGMVSQVLFSSFYPPSLERIRKGNPHAQVSFLFHQPWDSLEEIARGNSFPILNLRKSFLNKDKIATIHREGIKVNVYTLDSVKEMEQFIRWGVDGIITNRPDRLIKILQQRP